MPMAVKLKLMIIALAQNPRCLTGINRENLPVLYRSNKNAWMNSELFSYFLVTFDKHVKRRVILLMDNTNHILSIKETVLKYTKIIFLPSNTTAKLQPLDCEVSLKEKN